MYDFWRNRRIKAEDIIEAHRQSTVERIKDEWRVMVIQDTTELDFTHHRKKRGLGNLPKKRKGLKVHTAMCISDQGVPLGIIHQKVWASSVKNKKRLKENRKLPIEKKESYRWIESLSITEKYLSSTQRFVITMTDREGDIYELLTGQQAWGSEILIRGFHNRRVKRKETDPESESLWQVIRQSEPCGQMKVQLERASSLSRREASLTLRCQTLWIEPPLKNKSLGETRPGRSLEVILAEEENPPPGEKPISWLLLTTLGISRAEDVCVCVKWYSYRFLIERYHYVLKSGCGLEKLQLETAERIEKALATYAIVAWRLLWLTYEARINGEQSGDIALETVQWQALYCVKHQTACPPKKAPSLNECVEWLAQLGGYLVGKGRSPGVKVIWRGWTRLCDIVLGWFWGICYGLKLKEELKC